MSVTRRWPRPPDGAIHLIGDTHFGAPVMTANRKALWAADQVRSELLPEVAVHVVVGDLIDQPTNAAAQDAEAIAFMDTYFGAGRWISAVGNHDVGGQRTVDQAGAAWGMPGGSYVQDLDFARLVVIAPDDGIENDGFSMRPFTTARLNWLDAQLAGTDLPCLVVCHWALADTVGPSAGATISSFSNGFSAEVDADIRAVLADNPTAKAWLSGHTHSPVPTSPDLVQAVAVGGHVLAAVNASSPAYTGDAENNAVSEQYTMYLTVTDGRIDVRFRNHGAGIWYVAGPDREAVWSVTL